MRLDCHVHTRNFSKYGMGREFNHAAFMADLNAAGMDGAAVYSPSRLLYPDMPVEERMQITLDICRGQETLFPIYWVDPMEEGAVDQVDLAVKMGFDGFKIICYKHHPACRESMEVLERIAAVGKPVIFHSGMCWDGLPSSDNLRPAAFECLMKIQNLRFCLAHISWPWTDECTALYGKISYARRTNPNITCEMFVDVTPGTPKVYRDDVFRRLLCSYNLREHLMFGSDKNTADYDAKFCREWQEIDDELYDRYIPNDSEDFKDHVYRKNLLRFLGKE